MDSSGVIQLKPHDTPEARAMNKGNLVKWLMGLAQEVSNGLMETDAHAIMVAFIGPDGPEVIWNGIADRDQLREVPLAIYDLLADPRYKIHTESSVELTRKFKQQEQERVQKYLEEYPWLCGGDRCQHRFKTERGALIHERRCWHMKQNTTVDG